MHCNSCVAKLGKVLDQEPAIHHWNADINSPGKTVTVHGQISEDELVTLVRKAGFDVNSHTTVACDMNTPTIPVPSKNSFWSDRKVWKRASFNTLSCLLGCSIGDFMMLIYLQVYHPHVSMWWQMVLAISAGLITSVMLETILMRYREKFNWNAAFKMAISMSFLSMVAMEIAMNATDFMFTGGKAQLSSIGYWLAFIPAALAGFLTPLPYNYYKLKKHNKACH